MTDVTRRHAGQLDSLRAVAVVAVIFSHSIASDIELGSYAVYLFFVLSGFLITSQILAAADARERTGGRLRTPLLRFYARRALRLFPAYYLAIGGAALVGIHGMRGELPWHLLHASNLLFALHPDVAQTSAAGHLWSLSVEEQFYLIWPIMVLIVPRYALPAVVAAAILLGACSWFPNADLPDVVAGMSIVDSLDSLGVGALIALAAHAGWSMRLLGPVSLVALVACIPGLILAGLSGEEGAPLLQPYIHETMLIAFAGLVVGAASGIGGVIGRLLDSSLLQYIGRISYGMYLYHLFLLEFYWKLFRHFGLPVLDYGPALFPLVLSLTILAAMLSWHLVELPVNRLRRHFAYPQRGDAQNTPPNPLLAPAALVTPPPAA